ncbi:MAG TPA: hypothetical protein VL947_02345 [Cytophagales bacterium]|nr:hypothetical protein [Cytophagales bacterium]
MILTKPREGGNSIDLEERAAHRLMAKIKLALGKSERAAITVREFCRFMEIDEDEVRLLLGE